MAFHVYGLFLNRGFLLGCSVMALTTACATKKYVSRQIDPLQQRISAMEKKSSDQGAAIETLEADLSKTRERVIDLDGNLKQTAERAAQAGERAGQADAKAGQAASAAEAAQKSATDARSYAERRASDLERWVENTQNYKLVKSINVLFGNGRSDLDAEARAAIDEMAGAIAGLKRYLIEVQGYTDSTGPAAFNLALSQRRAEGVARYLNGAHKVPLRAIHVLGSGSMSPVADNKTRAGRRQNRRVEIRLFAPEATTAPATSAQAR